MLPIYKKKNQMKKLLIFLLITAVIIAVVLIILKQKGISIGNVLSNPESVSLRVDCSVEDLGLTAMVNVSVSNSSSKTFRNISVRVTVYDENGDEVTEKTTTFDRKLGANDSFTKPVKVPLRSKTCDCEIISSDAE